MDIKVATFDYVVPNCCGGQGQPLGAFLTYTTEQCLDELKFGPKLKPIWGISTKDRSFGALSVTAASFCPFCGKKLPEIVERKSGRPAKICTYSDGGYYCDTCKERLRNCRCSPTEMGWEPAE